MTMITDSFFNDCSGETYTLKSRSSLVLVIKRPIRIHLTNGFIYYFPQPSHHFQMSNRTPCTDNRLLPRLGISACHPLRSSGSHLPLSSHRRQTYVHSPTICIAHQTEKCEPPRSIIRSSPTKCIHTISDRLQCSQTERPRQPGSSSAS